MVRAAEKRLELLRIGLWGNAGDGTFCPSLLVARDDHDRAKHEADAHTKRNCQ
jgi:hypothetical protein